MGEHEDAFQCIPKIDHKDACSQLNQDKEPSGLKLLILLLAYTHTGLYHLVSVCHRPFRNNLLTILFISARVLNQGNNVVHGAVRTVRDNRLRRLLDGFPQFTAFSNPAVISFL